MTGLVTVLRAADAAARWHVNQRRKGAAQEPYITHLLEVARLVGEATNGADHNLIVAALLHDTIEDQGVTREEIAAQFNDDVAALVVEVTDDKKLPKAERKRLQIKHAPNLTPRAKILKLADKISNLRSLATSPPADWPMQRRADYVIWTVKLCRVSGARPAYSNRSLIGRRRMLSGQFPWRQKVTDLDSLLTDRKRRIIR
jgi:guanosine-3',5'-bis(diphosphate) 3'-pyrophosphohydrolase